MAHACDVHEIGEPDTELRHLTDDLADPTVDRERDTWLVRTSEGSPAGFAILIGREPSGIQRSFARVHPEHRGEGLGKLLLRSIVERARARVPAGAGAPVLHAETSASDTSAMALLASRGYTEVRRLHHLQRLLTASDSAPTDLPDGLSARPIHKGSDVDVVEGLDAACFSGSFGYERLPLDQWSRDHLEPALEESMVVFDGDELVGFSLLLPGEPPWIEILAVAERWRRRGVATWMLRRAFADLASQGARSVRLAVDGGNQHGAPGLYAGVGMEVRRTFAVHELTL